MSNSLSSAPEQTSEPAVHRESLPTPASEFPRGREIPAKGDGNESGGVTGEHEGEAECRAIVADKDCPPEEVAGSSGPGQVDQYSRGAMKDGGLDRQGNGVADNDDGYHTPTSPSHRIPADLPCPPAPKKIPPKRLGQKRKVGHQQIYRAVRRCLRLPGEFQLVLCPVVDVPPAGLAEDAGGDDVVE